MFARFIESQTETGEVIRVGSRRIHPISRSDSIRLPGIPNRILWKRPSGVLVTEEDGSETFLPVHDATRRAQWMILLVGFVGSLFLWRASRMKSR